MKILLAFDSYKGCLSAEEVCGAARAGILSVCSDAEVFSVPLSDGGEGLVACFSRLCKGREVSVEVHGPLMEKVVATYLLSNDGKTAYMEMASACGLTLVPAEKRNVMDATTYGLGELMMDAVQRGVTHIVLGIGGSATCDAGMGMLEVLHGVLCYGDDFSLKGKTEGVRVTVACDVDNPLYGQYGAAYVFAPQKGATPVQVKTLDRRLRAFALATEELGIAEPLDAFRPGTGAAGGLGYALLTYLKAELKPGIDVVLDACRFDAMLEGADWAITGEGCSDAQTLHGKVASGVLKRAKLQGVKTVLMSGQIKDKAILQAFGFECLCGINEGDERPLSLLMQADVAVENIKKTCQRLMEEYQ